MHEKYFLTRQKRGEFIGMFKKLRDNEFSAAFLNCMSQVYQTLGPKEAKPGGGRERRHQQ